MSVKNIEIQDSEGNIYYPHTDSSVVKSGNTTVSEELKAVNSRIDNIKIADGTITTKGIVKLNNATNSTSQTEASTPLAVKTAMDRANEAFTSASNGKNYIAERLGDVTGSSTFTQIGDTLQNDKNIIANNLNNKGIEASGNYFLSNLANKISYIQTLPGVSEMKSGTYVQSERVKQYYNINLPATACGTDWDFCFGSYSGTTSGTFSCFWHRGRALGYTFFSSAMASSPNVSATSGGWNVTSLNVDRGSSAQYIDLNITINWKTVKL